MVSATTVMPRIRRSYKIDERVIEALANVAAKSNMSSNRYLENLLFSHGQTMGEIPFDAQPLGETRGGNRTSSTQPETEDSANG